MKSSVLIFSFLCAVGIFQTYAQIVFNVTIQNNRHHSVDITFKEGELFEVQGENMQHIALFADTTIILRGRETKTIQLQGYCTNQHRNSPSSGQEVAPTFLVFNAPIVPIVNQQSLWERIRENRRR
jgi:hypothetical protein